jgi:mannose-6-phosphate isomerase-like protein (cupin superfamily)
MSSIPATQSQIPFSFLNAGEEEAIWFLDTLMTVKATGETTGGAFDMIEELIPAGFSPPPHLHHREEECFYVLSGRLTFFYGDQTIAAGPGAFVVLPRDVLHTFRVEGTEPAHMLEINAPAGLVGFFRDMGEPARERTLPPPRPLDITKLHRVAHAYGCEIPSPNGR